MKILHIIYDLRPTAGTTVFVLKLAREQARIGHKVSIAVNTLIEPISIEGVEIVVVRNPSKFHIKPDIVHFHAVWSVWQVSAMRWCRKRNYKYVVSIHGCLMPRVFAKNPLKKWIFYWLFLKSNIQEAGIIHCTSAEEVCVCQKLGFKGSFIVAPLGVDIPEVVEHHVAPTCRMVLFLGRLSEEKGLITLLDAWKLLPNDGWRLVLVGPDLVGYKKVLEAKIEREAIRGVEFFGEAHGTQKDLLYNLADIFVLPSPMENFSMVVLEALAHGVPVIATRGTPWNDLEDHKCGWWIGQGVDALGNALKTAMELSDEARNAMGNRGRQLAAIKYQWCVISEVIVNAYERVLKDNDLQGLIFA